MKKSTKLIIEIVAVVVVFAVASVAYNQLKKDAPSSSYVPTISAEKAETVVASNSSAQDTATVEAIAATAKSTTSTDTQTSESEMSSEDVTVADEATGEEEVKEEAGSSLMPDIPVIMYPSKDESTFWDVVPKGKPVVINLFASWCPPCIEEMPGFVEVRESYKDDVTFIFFDSFDGSRETEATLKTFVDKYFAEDTLVVMDPGYMGYIFNSNSIPLTIILNDKGEIVRGFQGSINKDVLIGELEKLI